MRAESRSAVLNSQPMYAMNVRSFQALTVLAQSCQNTTNQYILPREGGYVEPFEGARRCTLVEHQ